MSFHSFLQLSKYKAAGNFILSFFAVYLFHRIVISHWSLLNALLSFPVFLLASFSSCGSFFLLMLILLFTIIYPGWHVVKVSILSDSILDTIFNTNTEETIGFIASLPIKYYGFALGIFIISLLAFYFRSRVLPFSYNNKLKSLVTGFAVLLFITDIFINRSIFIDFYNNITYKSAHKLPAPSWQYAGPGKQQSFINNILIIGESSRPDFWSLYGAGENTTPFVNKVPKKYITNFIAPAINTTLSVPRLLAVTDRNRVFHPENNIVALANSGGVKTYWFSTQGYMGKYSNSTSQIADFASRKKFFKAYSDDFLLLPELKNACAEKGRKFIVLHTIGSHVPVKKRVENYKSNLTLTYNSHANAYLKSIEKTDQFIKEVYEILKNQEESFSIIYVSDHGSNIVKDGGNFKELRSSLFKQTYVVPFLQIDSTARATVKYDMMQSGYNLPFYLPYWLNFKTNLQLEKDIFSSGLNARKIKVMNYDQKLHPFSELRQGLQYDDIIQK